MVIAAVILEEMAVVTVVEIKINTKEDLFDAVQGAILGRRQYRLRISDPSYDALLDSMEENIKLTKYLLANREMHSDSRHEMQKILTKLEQMKREYSKMKDIHYNLTNDNKSFT